jgi:hypothetical protein
MTWQDWLAVCGFLLAVAGIPSSYFAFRTLLTELVILPDEVERLAAEIRHSLTAARAKGRVLLEFDMERAAVEGTLENIASRFSQLCPLEEDRRLLPHNPLGLMRSNATIYFMFRFYGYMVLFLFVFLWLLFFFIPSGPEARSTLQVIMFDLVFFGISALLASVAFLIFRRARAYKRGHDAAEGYLNFLKEREIFIRVEFTQSADAFSANSLNGPKIASAS